MRATTALKSTAVVCGAVVAGLLATGGTWALWNTSVTTAAGTVQAADFRITLTGTDSSPMTLPDGTAATVSMKGGQTELVPDTSVYAEVTIANDTNAGGPFDVQASLGTPSLKGTPESLSPWLSTSTAPAPRSGTCSAADYTRDATATISKGDSAKLCLQVTLDADAPETATRQTATMKIPVKAKQTR